MSARGALSIDDISTTSYFAIEWINRYSGNTYQLSLKKGTLKSVLACRLGGERLWGFDEIMLSAFATKPPESFSEFIAVAERYVQ